MPFRVEINLLPEKTESDHIKVLNKCLHSLQLDICTSILVITHADTIQPSCFYINTFISLTLLAGKPTQTLAEEPI